MARRKNLLKTSVAAVCLAAAFAAPEGVFGQSEKAAPAAEALEVRAGQAADFSRIEFRWAGGASAAAKREGQKLTLRFSRNATPNLANLKAFPPRWLKDIKSATVGGRLEVEITLADGADAKVGQAEGATYVNLFETKPVVAAGGAADAPALMAAQPVKIEPSATATATVFKFNWPETVAAAVFRRGQSVWIVFDTPAVMDATAVPHIAPQFTRFETIKAPGYSAVRIDSPVETPIQVSGGGAQWIVTLGGAAVPPAVGVTVARDKESDLPGLAAAVAGATRAIWVEDPGARDRFVAVPALGPPKGLDARRRYADLNLMATVQGLAIEPRSSDLTVSVEGDLVRINRPSGLALSSPSAITDSLALADGPQPAAMPAVVDFQNWARLGPDGFFSRYDALRNAAAEESHSDAQAAIGKAPQVNARMALARFLAGSELEFEAIGVLDLLAKTQPQMLSDKEFRGLRGAVKAMAGRYDDASGDFAAPVLAADPSAALWRGYIASKMGRWTEARQAFPQGYAALAQFSPDWKARFTRADAEAAINLNDIKTATTQLTAAAGAGAGAEENLATSLWRGRLYQSQGDTDRALEIFDAVSRSPKPELSAAATLWAGKLRLSKGKITPTQAADIFDGLRFRWRGDAIEVETIRTLGQLNISLGRYREALYALRSAVTRDRDVPGVAELQTDLSNVFRALFIEGKADGLQPLDALALWEDFAPTLAPIGAEGDQMVRNISRRLVDVDLLEQAERNLEWQAIGSNRLQGVAKAVVATDLAMVYLMDRKPEQALNAINVSRTTILPNDLNSRRRLLSARALMGLGRYDDALEMIEMERNAEAEDLRAEIAWGKKDWVKSAASYEKRLGDRWKSPAALTVEDETRLLRAAISFSLANDDASLARLRERFSKYLDAAHSPDSLRLALAGIDGAQLTPADFTRVMNDGDTFSGWVTRAKQQFRQQTGRNTRTAAATPTPAKPATTPAAGAPKAG